MVRARQCVAFLVLVALVSIPAARGDSSVGMRIGYSQASGELFSGDYDFDWDGVSLYGVQLELDFLRLVTFEAAGEYTKSDFTIKGASEQLADGDYEDFLILGSVKLNVFSLPGSPLRVYVGGGLNAQFVDKKVAIRVTDQSGESEIEEKVKDILGEDTEVGWHALAGAKLKFPAAPLFIFLEARYNVPFSEDAASHKSVYAGVGIGV